MDLSELSAGLKRKGSLYKDCYNEYGLEKELKNIYAINAQHWIPRTEQTEINERMALDRKLRRMIAGKDTESQIMIRIFIYEIIYVLKIHVSCFF